VAPDSNLRFPIERFSAERFSSKIPRIPVISSN